MLVSGSCMRKWYNVTVGGIRPVRKKLHWLDRAISFIIPWAWNRECGAVAFAAPIETSGIRPVELRMWTPVTPPRTTGLPAAGINLAPVARDWWQQTISSEAIIGPWSGTWLAPTHQVAAKVAKKDGLTTTN
jgi:hypothetical protein